MVITTSSSSGTNIDGWDGMVVVTACEAAVRADVTKLERYRKTAVCNYVSFRFDYVHTPYTVLLCLNNRGSRPVLVPGIQGVFSETQYNKKKSSRQIIEPKQLEERQNKGPDAGPASFIFRR